METTQATQITYTVNTEYMQVFDKAVGLLFQAERGHLGDVQIKDYIDLAYLAAIRLVPQIKSMPFGSAPSQLRRAVQLASSIWMAQTERDARCQHLMGRRP